ncbi:uncharacterized protein B0H18DRAFT_1044638 [Fomitopsis serialis]|uniref:uncharacterized protein n=1 Tax=Fomitopsis serialis TaxID=139415 RepID=UPI0020082002|nr:uncharacterized protein B0H18DRAFT_1044638 [Neoantrodia serialis]KAH9914605.1 hypothetical protein B0H18DRAFT_1044638 [Neoantrodia serialis]
MASSDSTAYTQEHFKQTLQALVDEDDRLKPFFTLLQAVEEPDADHREDVLRAFTELQNSNEAEGHGPSKKADAETGLHVFELHPFAEMVQLGHEIEGEVLHVVHGLKPHDKQPSFSNWGKTVSYDPGYTLVIRTIRGVCEVVKWAAKKGKKVRVAGFRHTWGELFGAQGDVMIMFLPIESLTKLPYKQPPSDWKTELSGIEVVKSVAGRAAPSGHAFCKIMAGTTNDQLREWSFNNKTWSIPFNVIMVEITFGGSNAPICHGSGFSSTTLSDLVVEITYVDAHGELQTVNDPDELRAASGCFGLLGVVVSITLQLDAMGVAELVPVHTPLPLAIPPPKGYAIPKQVQSMIEKSKITEAQLEDARTDFVRRCEEDYYLEWFWFPYQEHVWINTWKKYPMTPKDGNLDPYPGDSWFDGVKSQELQSTAAEVVTSFFLWKDVPGYMQAWLFGVASMAAMPNITDPKKAIKTYVSEAVHFRRGIQNFRCWDTEWEVPVPSIQGKRDYDAIQRAWWDGISAMYSQAHDAPARIALEMRLTGASDVILAPQRTNALGTVSIEVLTTLATPKDMWADFMQLVADKWTGYDSKGADDRRLLPRPHWAKQWDGLQVRGKPVVQYLKEDAYGEAFVEFRDTFQRIVTTRGCSVGETRSRFGNALMDSLVFGPV